MKHIVLFISLFLIGATVSNAQVQQMSNASKKIPVSWHFPEIDSGDTNAQRFVINLDEHPIYQYAVIMDAFPEFFNQLKMDCGILKESPCILLCIDSSLIPNDNYIDIAEITKSANPDLYAKYISGEKKTLNIFASKKPLEVYDWIQQELTQGRLVSLVYENPLKKKTHVTARSVQRP